MQIYRGKAETSYCPKQPDIRLMGAKGRTDIPPDMM